MCGSLGAPTRQEGDEAIIDERPYGEFARQFFRGENPGSDRLSADTRDGVLTLTVPVSEKSKPRRVQLGSSSAADSSAAPNTDAAT